jgi:hypothetical protein
MIPSHVDDPDRRSLLLTSFATFATCALPAAAGAATGNDADVVETYRRFVTAQNAGDLDAVRSLFTDTPRFLWVSDGQSIWGRDAAIERMSIFRQSEVWRVLPDLDSAVAVRLDDRTAYLNLSLVLEIGSRSPGPDRLPFLVSMLAHREADNAPFRIAALFTTTRKPG